MKRLFAAIKIHPDESLSGIYWALKRSLKEEKIRWVDIENIHITLKFFGETPEHHIPAIIAALKSAANGVEPFTLDIMHTGVFGSSYQPRVIWFGIDKNEGLAKLAGNVAARLEDIGIEDDRQNFVPHLTIGRIKALSDKKYFQRTIDKHKESYIKKEEVSEFHLFESILGPQGPKYLIVDSFPLAM
ncbi:MAG TPA: RNA 2',3'-cyclic phosphodiesterase [Bacteroidales bacterium]|nr:RNA 2',3'-cyclic phosphodiesterase [Bacteroidales bacterium]